MNYEPLYPRIARYYRANMNLTQRQVAEHFGVSTTIVINAMESVTERWDENELSGRPNESQRFERLIYWIDN